MPRRLKNLKVDFIALVEQPANNKSIILKSSHHQFHLSKSNDDMQRAYGIVYSPEEEDLQGDIADADTIREAANAFMRDGLQKNIDIEHSFKPIEDSYLAESWIVRKNDPLFPDEKEGAWAVGIQIDDGNIWQRFKSGDFTGISLAGQAQTEPPITKNEVPPSWFSSWLQNMRKTTSHNINEEQLLEKMTDYLKSEFQTQVDSRNQQNEEQMWNKITKHVDEQIRLALKKGRTESGTASNVVLNKEDSYV